MLAIEIGLAIWAWRRGWKAWALLPIGIIFLIGFILGVAKIITLTNLWTMIFFDLALIVILTFMGIKPHNKYQPYNMKDNGSPAAIPVIQESLSSSVVPENFCVNGQLLSSELVDPPIPLQPVTQIVNFLVGAKLTLPDNSEILLTEPVKIIGRNDFDKVVSPEALKYISRNHLLIKSDNGKYFVEDLNSTNGTKANGIGINGGKRELDSGDRIQIADKIEITFSK